MTDDTQAGGGDTITGGDTVAGGQGGDTITGGGAGGKWWEDKRWSDEDRTFFTAKGLTLEDRDEVLAKLAPMYRNAEGRLGRSPEAILDKPKEGQALPEWMRANAAVFGLPEKPEGYEVTKPEGWPKEAQWDTALETEARKIAHEHAMTPSGLNAMVGLYAKAVKDLDDKASTDLAASNDRMMADLTKDWGEQLPARLTRARQAAAVVAEKAGLDADGIQHLGQLISEKAGGDAVAVKVFDAIAGMMGEDSARGLGAGANQLGLTPAEARAELAKLQGPEGEYFKAAQEGNAVKLKELRPRIEQLSKLAAR